MLQPQFFPWTQLQSWLLGNPGELSRRRTSLAGGTPERHLLDPCRPELTHLGEPGSGLWVPRLFHDLRDSVSLFSVPALQA